MCSISVIEWICNQALKQSNEMQNARVLEVGSKNVNGSIRRLINNIWKPSEYIGVDISSGKGVDRIVDVTNLFDTFGGEAFDAVICTEVLEHVRLWRTAVCNLKAVLRTNGLLLLTTRSYGMPYHGYPSDYWRFEVSDMEKIFADMEYEIEPDQNGVFVCAKNSYSFNPLNPKISLEHIPLYSVTLGHRTLHSSELTTKRKFLLVARKLGERFGINVNVI